MPTGSPLLDDYDRTGIVTPGLQRALDATKAKLGQPFQLQRPTQPGPTLAPPGPNVPSLARPQETAGITDAPSAPAFSPTPSPISLATPQRAPLTQSPLMQHLQARHEELTDPTLPTSKPGVDRIQNPWLRTPLKVLEAIGTGFAPRLTSAIPGTSLHHRGLVQTNEAEQNQLEKQETEHANREHLGAETAELGARGANETAEAAERNNPRPKNMLDLFLRDNPNGTADEFAKFQEDQRPITNDFEAWAKQNPGKPVSDFLKMKNDAAAPKEGEMPLGADRVSQYNSALLDRVKVLNPGTKSLPSEYTLGANATQKDFDRVDKLLEAKERAAGVKAQQDTAATNRQNKEDVSTRQAAFKSYQPSLDSAERFNVMAKNYEDAVKTHDQQAMLSLLANHLGMTMGLQKGARLNRDIIREAEQSRPWLQGLKAKFDKDGYLQGVTLTPEQMRQMVSLGRERFAEDLTKGRNEARYLGSTDEGPERTPNEATMRFYLSQTNGDVGKAKELAGKDGWSVK